MIETVRQWALEWRCQDGRWPGWLLKYGSNTDDLMFFWNGKINGSGFENDQAWTIFTNYGFLDAWPASIADAFPVECP